MLGRASTSPSPRLRKESSQCALCKHANGQQAHQCAFHSWHNLGQEVADDFINITSVRKWMAVYLFVLSHLLIKFVLVGKRGGLVFILARFCGAATHQHETPVGDIVVVDGVQVIPPTQRQLSFWDNEATVKKEEQCKKPGTQSHQDFLLFVGTCCGTHLTSQTLKPVHWNQKTQCAHTSSIFSDTTLLESLSLCVFGEEESGT
ncbi:hypothetical protein Pelo_6031 [Pelomyxa schiedti]|nr:hypothetical protein Pelo_6031 [Pelomyxa schiedti]